MSDVRDTGTPQLLADVSGGVLTLTLNRPEARNALTDEMFAALAQQLTLAEGDDAIRCVLLTGAGKGFCSGGDVKKFASDAQVASERTTERDIQQQRLWQRDTSGKLHAMPKPTIAAINGAAAGAGLSLALACDLRIMASNAVLTTAFARVGLAGDYGGTYFLSKLVGTAKARELYFLSERVGAAEAERLGLANWIVEPDALAAKATEIATRLASGPTVAFGYMKENLNRAIGGDPLDCMNIEATHHIHCFDTADHKEGARAFVEKREPRFGASGQPG
jgi:2-(1,2-epoxy-1,2-dihydrophenyl)acetyl-CoA isomerase